MRRRWHRRTAVVMTVALLLTACSDDDEPTAASSTTITTEAAPRQPEVEAATVEGPITVGEPSLPADPHPVDLDAIGYVQEEFFASGTATAYAAEGELPADGRWKVMTTMTAPYKTRFVVRRPADPADFSGTVVVEWTNVSAVEASPDWAYTSAAIVDAGAAWVGVSAQALGVVGGQALIQTGTPEQGAQTSGGIKGGNPERYGSLEHPGDVFAFDIYSQVGAALRSPGEVPVFGDAEVQRVIAAGESQSAAYLTGYVNGIQPVANVFDGFFVHSRGAGAALPDGTRDLRGAAVARPFRTDLDVPIIVFETETDVGPLLNYASSRQPDTDLLRTWEVPGTAHADAYLVGGQFALCPAGINTGPQHYVAKAAMAGLIRWVEDGVAPPEADRIETEGPNSSVILRDEHGNALGGIRTPSVEVPAGHLTGEGVAGAPVLCALFGGATPFDAEKLRSLYGTPQDYVDAFETALDDVIEQGFVREAERDEYLAEARAVRF